MGDLFPDKPNHRPIPDHQHIDGKDAIISISVIAAAAWSCPKLEERHDHAPEQQHAGLQYPVIAVAGSSGGSSEPVPPPMPFVNTDNSAVIAHHWARRNAQTMNAIRASQLMMNNAALFPLRST